MYRTTYRKLDGGLVKLETEDKPFVVAKQNGWKVFEVHPTIYASVIARRVRLDDHGFCL